MICQWFALVFDVWVSGWEAVSAAYDELDTAFNKVAALSHDALTHTDLLAVQSRREVLSRRQCAVDHQIINRLAAEVDPKALGAKNLANLLATRLRISPAEAGRRIKHSELLGPRRALTGEPLQPQLPTVAAAQQRGEVGVECAHYREVLPRAARPYRLPHPRGG